MIEDLEDIIIKYKDMLNIHPNRTLFSQTSLTTQLNSSNKKYRPVIYLDIEYFKKENKYRFFYDFFMRDGRHWSREKNVFRDKKLVEARDLFKKGTIFNLAAYEEYPIVIASYPF